MNCTSILETAASLISGERNDQHGDKETSLSAIAKLWNAFLSIRMEPAAPLSPSDAAMLMALLKIARTQGGARNDDDYVDAAGYIAIAGDLAALKTGLCGRDRLHIIDAPTDTLVFNR